MPFTIISASLKWRSRTETFERLLKQAVPDGKTIREIRIRTEKPVMILLESGENLLFSDGTCGKTESYGKKKMGSLEIREDRSVVLADQELIRGILETCSRHSLYAFPGIDTIYEHPGFL